MHKHITSCAPRRGRSNGQTSRPCAHLRPWLAALVVAAMCASLFACNTPGKPATPTPVPTPDASAAQVLASKSGSIGPDGGTLSLEGGVRLVFPPGAVGESVSVQVNQLNPAQFLDSATDGVVLECSAPVAAFQQPVEFHVPLPAWFTPELADMAIAGVWDGASGTLLVEPSSVVMANGQPELVLSSDHFSWRIFEWFRENFGNPPAQAGPLEIPYYSQSGGYCWATTLHMLNESARHSQTSEVFGIVGFIGIDDTGLGARAARTYPSISGLMSAATGVWPERNLWARAADSALRSYIRRQLAFLGRPVGLIFGKHAWVYVGYDGTYFYVMDPQGMPGDMYKRGTWEQLGLTNDEEKVSVVVPAPLASDRPLLTVNIKDESLEFVNPARSTGDVFRLRWDHTRRDRGYSWESQRNNASVAAIPGEVTELKVVAGGEGIEVANSQRSGGAAAVLVSLEIVGQGPARTHYLAQTNMNVAPGEMQPVRLDPIPVSAFRDPAPAPVEYSLRVRVSVGGKTVDDAAVSFVLEPAGTSTPVPSPTLGPSPTPTTQAAASGAAGEWVLQAILLEPKKTPDSDCYFDHQLALHDGLFRSSGSWKDEGCVSWGSKETGTIQSVCAWTAPPSYLKVGSTLSMDLSCEATAQQTGGDRASGAQGMIWYTLRPPAGGLSGFFGGSRRIVPVVTANGSSSSFPLSASGNGSVEVPAGSKGDVLVVVVSANGQGGSGIVVYKYAYQGTDPVPPRETPPAVAPLPPQPGPTPTPEATPTATPTLEPTPTAVPPVEAEPTPTPTEEPGAGEREMFVITSVHAALNGASSPSRFAITQPWLVTRLVTYHWNGGRGVAPGYIMLRADDGTPYGPWQAEGLPGSGGVPNAYWQVKPNALIPAGGYSIIDSEPATWSQNEETGGRGMSWGYGIPR